MTKITITLNRQGSTWEADIKERPGSPWVGHGATKEEAVAMLFSRMLNAKDSYLPRFLKEHQIVIDYQGSEESATPEIDPVELALGRLQEVLDCIKDFGTLPTVEQWAHAHSEVVQDIQRLMPAGDWWGGMTLVLAVRQSEYAVALGRANWTGD